MTHSSSLSVTTVHLAFIALFPCFFFYNTAMGTGVIGPVLGGYFSLVSLVFTPILLIIYLVQITRTTRFFTSIDLAFFSFLFYFLFVISLNFANGAERDLVKDHLLSIVHLAAVFIVFRIAQFESPQMKWTGLLCIAGMTAIIFTFSVDGFFYLKEQQGYGDSRSMATYQGFARSYFVTFLVVLPFMRLAMLRLAMYFICVPALFINGARSELTAILLVVVLAELFFARPRLSIAVFALTLASLFFVFSDNLMQLLPDNRSLELLDLSRSTSWEGRQVFFSNALRTIADHPLLGDYGSYIRTGGAGSYAHNIFSAWVDLGFFGFAYLLCMMLFPIYFLLIDTIFRGKRPKSEEPLLALILLCATLFMLFTSKDFTYMLVGAALGRYAHYRHISYTAQAKQRLIWARHSRVCQTAQPQSS
ncbi:MAG: O-antigen ligase family protein [Pseudomonadota bacterium]|nr:O-antigen ligase family protein [Pseudomonadota bacterium]